jgi:putative ABC transport system permease protein
VIRFLLLLKTSLRAINRNKLRSGLTVLGIVIGVAAVIAMVGIGQGASAQVQAQISSLGDNLITVFPGSESRGGHHGGAGSMSTLTAEDAEAIAAQIPHITAITPVARSGGQVVFGNQNWSTEIMGGDVDYLSIRRWRLDSGSNFSESAVRSAAKVAILGRTVANQLFGEGSDPVGETIRINKMPFTVVGTLAPKGQNTWGRDQDDTMLLPYTTVMKKVSGQTYLSMVQASAESMADLPGATEAITSLLRQRHRIPEGEEDDFTVRTQQDIADIMGSTSKVMRGLLAAIASVSLLVGGIGIMNIMLVSVTERTREIGIRMAVGAKGWHVMIQFLSEAIVLACFGGLIGIALGLTAARLVAHFARWPIQISPQAIVIAFGFSALVGIFFGFWPARKAARLDPIEALRYE